MIAALMSLAFVPPNVSGPVARDDPPAKTVGLQLAFCQVLVNGARYSRVGLVGRDAVGRRARAGSGREARVGVVAGGGCVGGAPYGPRAWRAVSPAPLWRSSNVHGAAGAWRREAADDAAVGARPVQRRVVLEVVQVRLVGGRVEPAGAAQHLAGLGVDEQRPGERLGAVVDDVDLEAAAGAAGGRDRDLADLLELAEALDLQLAEAGREAATESRRRPVDAGGGAARSQACWAFSARSPVDGAGRGERRGGVGDAAARDADGEQAAARGRQVAEALGRSVTTWASVPSSAGVDDRARRPAAERRKSAALRRTNSRAAASRRARGAPPRASRARGTCCAEPRSGSTSRAHRRAGRGALGGVGSTAPRWSNASRLGAWSWICRTRRGGGGRHQRSSDQEHRHRELPHALRASLDGTCARLDRDRRAPVGRR